MENPFVNIKDCVIDNIFSGIVILDRSLNIVVWNEWFSKHSGLQFEAHANKNIYEVFPEIKESRVAESIESVLNLGFPSIISNIFTPSPFPLYPSLTFEKNKKNDDRLFQDVMVSRYRNNEEYFCLIQIQNVTSSVIRERTLEAQILERKKVEEELKKNEIRKKAIMDSMVDGLIIFDNSGTIESINPTAERMLNIDFENILNTKFNHWFEILSTRDSKNMHALLAEIGFLGKPTEVMAMRLDGSSFDAELSISVIEMASEYVFSAVVRDITERRKIEKLKAEFIATVSHELRTPLTSIKGALGLLAGGGVGEMPPAVANLVQVAHKNSNRLLLLINDILDFEKISSGKMEFDITECDVISLLSQVIDSNRAYAENYKVSYRFICDVPAIPVLVDENRFIQVITNVLSNAAKFSNPHDYVDISVVLDKNNALISVRDYGVGIPSNFQRSIWDKFTQANSSSTKLKGGTGLGLAISKSLIEAMNGNIYFKSEENKGATFYIAIPLARHKAAI